MTVYSVLSSILPIVVLTLLQDAVCARKKDKAKLALLTPLAFIYSIVGVLIIWKYHIWIEWILQGYDAVTYAVIVSNMILMAGFIIVKYIAGRMLIKGWTKKDLIEATSSRFYSYAEDFDTWFLQYRWTNYRSFLNVIRWLIVGAAGLFLCFINSRSGETVITLTFPCSVVIIMNELFHFVNGETRAEFEHNFRGEAADARRISSYFRIREIFEHLLPKPLLSSLTGFELAGRRTAADLVKTLSQSEDKYDRITADYYNADNRYMEAETDGVEATRDLMHGRNVVYNNPFYRDLELYITLPIVRALVSGRKCAVITGRMSAKEDVIEWLDDLLGRYTHMPSLWHVKSLSAHKTDCEVGVLSFPELYDSRVVLNNEEFFGKTDFVILIEPSAILSTGQVALSILSKEIERGEEKPVYFVCDRVVDGLVDSLSHILRTEFTEVVAPPVPRCVYTGMTWNADGDFCRQQLFDRQTRYLGNGVELAAIAVKNQIPQVQWYGETKVPIRDIKWIAGQNYKVLCQYMNQPAQQSSIYDKIEFISSLWSAPKRKEQFAIVEDEFNNMFAAMRTFLSRGRDQSFVNVLSENYLLRDYMRCNQQMFLANPEAIPSIVPDYAKTERNTLLKLILLMRRRPVGDQEILDEYHLVGTDGEGAFSLLNKSMLKYTPVSAEVIDIDTEDVEVDDLTTQEVNVYTISPDTFRKYFEKTLAEAYYIVEEEEEQTDFVDARFFSHVTQSIMPGQFVTYAGKYYRVKHISPQTGVVLRRASDLFNERKYYRQIRKYSLINREDILLSNRKISDIEFAFIQRDIHVETSGYLDMDDVHDLSTARMVDLSKDPLIDNYTRDYRNKTMLRIRMPETDGYMRFTFCLLLSEMFRSIFPDGFPFLAVTAKFPEDMDGFLGSIVYPVAGDIEDDCIYIIEDSEVDLGLVEAVERNWDKLMNIMGDFLTWHFEKMEEPDEKDPEQPSYAYTIEKAEEENQSLLEKLIQRLRRILPSHEQEEKTETPETQDSDGGEAASEMPEVPEAIEAPEAIQIQEDLDAEEFTEAFDEETVTDTVSEDLPEAEEPTLPDPDMDYMDDPTAPLLGFSAESLQGNPGGEDSRMLWEELKEIPHLFDDSKEAGKSREIPRGVPVRKPADGPEPESEEQEKDTDTASAPAAKSRYRSECFLKFGYDEIDSRLKLMELTEYMSTHGWTANNLTHARKRELFVKTDLDTNAVNRCDFCGRALSGASYELMNDGRVRCNDCSASAITSVDELKELFYQALELMEMFYGIRFKVPVAVRMADARTVAKGAGMVFRPSTDYAARILGYAQKKQDDYMLIMENGSPRLAAIETMVHEMTHIWQYINWPDGAVNSIYNMGNPALTRIANDVVYEGMAVWASVQYLYQIGETQYASEIEMNAAARADVYGLGFLLFREQYPLVKDGALIRITPFASFPPIDPLRVKEVIASVVNAK